MLLAEVCSTNEPRFHTVATRCSSSENKKQTCRGGVESCRWGKSDLPTEVRHWRHVSSPGALRELYLLTYMVLVSLFVESHHLHCTWHCSPSMLTNRTSHNRPGIPPYRRSPLAADATCLCRSTHVQQTFHLYERKTARVSFHPTHTLGSVWNEKFN